MEEMYSSNDPEAIYAYNSLRVNHRFDEKIVDLKVPCLVYAGDLDEWVAGVREIVESNPYIRYVVLEGGGDHFGAFYRPDILKPYLLQFMKDHDFL